MADEGLDLGAVEDTGVESSGVETDLGTPETPDTGDQDPAEGADAARAEAQEAKLLVNGKFSPEFQAEIDRLKVEKPGVAKAITRALREVEGYRKALPQGLKEVRELRTAMQQYGGPDAIRQTREELAYFNDLDTQFTAADPRFVEALIDTPEGKDSFLKLGPAMFAKYSEMHPEGYKQMVAKAAVSEMERSGFRTAMTLLKHVIKANPEALEYFNQAASVFDKLTDDAEKKVELPKREQTPELDQRAQDLTQREQALARKDWSGEATSLFTNTYTSEFERQTKGLKVSGQDRAEINERVRIMLKPILDRENGRLEAFFAQGDRDGRNRHLTALYNREIPEVLKRAIAKTLPGRKAAVAAPKPGTPGAKPVAVEPGFQWVAKAPGLTEIDPSQTTQQMFLEGKAILRGGRKVMWGKRLWMS
jgi:hypothetical protein